MSFAKTAAIFSGVAVIFAISVEPAHAELDQQRPLKSDSTQDGIQLRPPLGNSPEELSLGAKLEQEANQFYAKGDFKNAVKLLRQSILQAQKEGLNDKGLYGLYNSLSTFAYECNDWEANYEALSGRAAIIKRRNDLPTLGYELILLSGAEIQAGRYEKSIEHLNLLIQNLESGTGNKEQDLILPYLLLGACYFESKNYSKANQMFNKIIGLSFEHTSGKDLAIALLFMSLIGEREGKPEIASQYYEQTSKCLIAKDIEQNPYDLLQKTLLNSLTKKRLESFEAVKK